MHSKHILSVQLQVKWLWSCVLSVLWRRRNRHRVLATLMVHVSRCLVKWPQFYVCVLLTIFPLAACPIVSLVNAGSRHLVMCWSRSITREFLLRVHESQNVPNMPPSSFELTHCSFDMGTVQWRRNHSSYSGVCRYTFLTSKLSNIYIPVLRGFSSVVTIDSNVMFDQRRVHYPTLNCYYFARVH